MKKILIVTGDPNSINSEIIYKTWKKINTKIKKRIYIISNYRLLKSQFKKLNYSIKMCDVKNIINQSDTTSLKIINIDLNFKDPFNVPVKFASKFVTKSLDRAHNLAQGKNVAGIINCAINKNLLGKKGIGVTEYLSKKCNLKTNSGVMLIKNSQLAVSPLTTHLNLSQVSKQIKKDLITKKVITINDWYKSKLRKKPKIAILGLNPHNAEFRKNSEEIKIIIPAIKILKKKGINLTGPLVADTIFINDYQKYDVIVGMYHDQVLAPFKGLYKYDAINITLGLRYLRLSPDHGTAFNLIKKNKASPLSLIRCLEFIKKYTR